MVINNLILQKKHLQHECLRLFFDYLSRPTQKGRSFRSKGPTSSFPMVHNMSGNLNQSHCHFRLSRTKEQEE